MNPNDRFIDNAVRQALNPAAQQHQQQPNVFPATLLPEFVKVGILTAEQAFNFVFRGQPPQQFEGAKTHDGLSHQESKAQPAACVGVQPGDSSLSSGSDSRREAALTELFGEAPEVACSGSEVS
jgi:hypothetical protein